MAKHPYLNFTESSYKYGKSVGTKNATERGHGLTNKAIKIVQIPPIFDDDCVVEIGVRAFGQTGITSVFIPKTVLVISFGAFEGSSLSEVRFEEGSRLEKVCGSVFHGCNRLKKIDFPSSVNVIESSTWRVFHNINLDCFSYLGASGFSNIYMFANVSVIHVSSSYQFDKLGWINVTKDDKTCNISHERFYRTRRLCNSLVIRYQCHASNFVFMTIFLSR